jgi:PIF1-like helicase
VKRLANASLVILDEISMMRAGEFDAIVFDLCKIGFSGVLLAVGNDAQLGPVIPRASPSVFLAHHVTRSTEYASSGCLHLSLRQNMRMADDVAFNSACNRLGYGVWDNATPFAVDGSQFVRLPCSMFPATPDRPEDVSAGRQWAFPTMFGSHPHVPFGTGHEACIIITPTRQLELEHNILFVDLLHGDCITYTARDEVSAVQGQTAPAALSQLGDDMVEALDDSGAPRGNIRLKIGATSSILH